MSRFTTALGTVVRCFATVPCTVAVSNWGSRAGKSSVRDFRSGSSGKSWDELAFTSGTASFAPARPFARVAHSHVFKTGCSHAGPPICTLPPPHAQESSVSPHASIAFTTIRPTVLQHQFPSFTASPSAPLVQPRVPTALSAWVSASHHREN